MRNVVFFSMMMIFIISTWVSCSKEGESNNDPCAGVTVAVNGTVTNATNGQNNGSIAATASGGSGFTFSINNGTFQASSTFASLAAGTYTITAKNSNGCTGSSQFTVVNNSSCTGASISLAVQTTAATPCGGAAGSITVTASGSSGFTYSLNNGPFQSSNIFSNLGAATYSITARDANGCSKTENATVGANSAGNLFSAVRTIVQNSCATSGCHGGSSSSGGVNFSDQCSIIASRDRIKARAVDAFGTPNQMPAGSGLSASERSAITNWINAGGGYSN
jgi:hypothetical protein